MLSSCATEEEIARRKALARVVEEMKSQQKITKNLSFKVNENRTKPWDGVWKD